MWLRSDMCCDRASRSATATCMLCRTSTWHAWNACCVALAHGMYGMHVVSHWHMACMECKLLDGTAY